jgi:hypothetical protein
MQKLDLVFTSAFLLLTSAWLLVPCYSPRTQHKPIFCSGRAFLCEREGRKFLEDCELTVVYDSDS